MPEPTLTYPVLAAMLAVGLPFAGFLLAAIWGKKSRNGLFAIVSISFSLILAIYVFAQVWNGGVIQTQWEWFTVGNTVFRVGILLDNLSAIMLLLVPLIALPVHIYSIAYMKGDPGIHRYWMFLSLFCFAMLGLVIADNLLLMYIFWELVGFASYLLIGFWFTKVAAVQANKKAFIINRIGDLGFLAGIALVYSQFGTLDIRQLFDAAGLFSQAVVTDGLWIFNGNGMPAVWLTVTGVAFFIGAMAKSAQFPLHVWLSDAMEGPTSVSSLIHAATMVAAGVFLLARIFPVFDETTLLFIAVIGTITALMAAFFALTQHDIKKILAFSTISQLGLMMVAIGIGSFAVAIFHLVIHAFFKCLLFLSAGAVIHVMQHIREKHQLVFNPQDIRNMGGLRMYMPMTFITMLIASLALAGLPLTAGYLSKDLLLIQAFEWGAQQTGIAVIIPYLLFVVSAMTAFYIARYVFRVFFTSLRIGHHIRGGIRPKEANNFMLTPMIFLAVCSLFPLFSINPTGIDNLWLVNGLSGEQKAFPPIPVLHIIIPILTSIISTILAIIAWQWYVRGRYPIKVRGLLYKLSYRQGYFDEIYQAGIVNPVMKLSHAVKTMDRVLIDGIVNGVGSLGRAAATFANWVDHHMVDGLVRLVGKTAYGLGNVLRHSQTGRVQYYLYTMFFAMLLALLYHLINQA